MPRQGRSNFLGRSERRSLEGDRHVKKLSYMLRDKRGASAAEYALILAIIGGALAIASLALGGEVAEAMNETASCIETSSDCTM